MLAVAFVVVALTTGLFDGGDDKEDAEQVVRDFVEATNERDEDKLCEDLLTEEYIEQTTGATGDAREAACKREFSRVRGLRLDLRSIRRTEIDGDEATVTAIIAVQGRDQPQAFRLEKQGGDWRLAGGGGG